MYIRPKHFTQLSQIEIEKDSIMSSTFETTTNLTNTNITADLNVHSPL